MVPQCRPKMLLYTRFVHSKICVHYVCGTNVGSDNFQNRKIHRKGVFCPDLRLRSGQGISSPDVVSKLGREFAPARTHAQNSRNSSRCGSPLGHLPSSCRLTLAHLGRHGLYRVVALRCICVCVGFSKSYNHPSEKCQRIYGTLRLASASRLVFNIHTVGKCYVRILIFRRRNECQEHL